MFRNSLPAVVVIGLTGALLGCVSAAPGSPSGGSASPRSDATAAVTSAQPSEATPAPPRSEPPAPPSDAATAPPVTDAPSPRATVPMACGGVVPGITPTDENAVASIPLGCEAGAVAVGGDSVWVVPHLERVMLRIDPSTNEIADRISLGDRGPGAEIAANDTMVWASVSSPSYDLERLVHVDPSSGVVVASVEVEAGSPVLGGGYVWAAGPAGIYRIDPATNQVQLLDLVDCEIVSDDVRVWCIGPDVAQAVDPQTGAGRSLRLDGQLGWPLAWANELIWGWGEAGLWAYDPVSEEIAAQLEPPEGAAGWALDGVVLEGELWVGATSTGGDPFRTAPDRLVRVDVEAHEANCVIETVHPEHGIAAGFGSIWFPVVQEPWLLRIEPACGRDS
jgi:hypothetical protein